MKKSSSNCILMSLLPLIIFFFMIINVSPLITSSIKEPLTTREKIINFKRDAIYNGRKIKGNFEAFKSNVKQVPLNIANTCASAIKNYTLVGLVT